MLALSAMRQVDTQKLVEIAVPLFFVITVKVSAARWLWQRFSLLGVLDAVDGVVSAWMALRALVECDTDVISSFGINGEVCDCAWIVGALCGPFRPVRRPGKAAPTVGAPGL